MKTPRATSVVRRAGWALALTPAVVLVTAATPAFAVAPRSWAPDPKVNLLYALLVLGGIPLALFVVISAIAYGTSADRSVSYQPGLSWRHEPAWFGGPRGGAAALETSESASADVTADRGGASARW